MEDTANTIHVFRRTKFNYLLPEMERLWGRWRHRGGDHENRIGLVPDSSLKEHVFRLKSLLSVSRDSKAAIMAALGPDRLVLRIIDPKTPASKPRSLILTNLPFRPDRDVMCIAGMQLESYTLEYNLYGYRISDSNIRHLAICSPHIFWQCHGSPEDLPHGVHTHLKTLVREFPLLETAFLVHSKVLKKKGHAMGLHELVLEEELYHDRSWVVGHELLRWRKEVKAFINAKGEVYGFRLFKV